MDTSREHGYAFSARIARMESELRTESVIYPYPMPSDGASVTFNFFMMHVPASGTLSIKLFP